MKKNVYISKCCEKPATKDPLKMPRENRVGRLGHAPKNENMKQGLHGFRCTGCRKPCSCNRHVVDVEDKKTTARRGMEVVAILSAVAGVSLL